MSHRVTGLAELLPQLECPTAAVLARPQTSLAVLHITPHEHNLATTLPAAAVLDAKSYRKSIGSMSRGSSRSRSRCSSRANTPPAITHSEHNLPGERVLEPILLARPQSSCVARPGMTPRHAYFQRELAKQDCNPYNLLQKISAHLKGGFPVRRTFCYFDRRKQGVVSYEDFRTQLQTFGVVGGEETTMTLFNHYDRDEKGYLVFEDFQNIQREDSKGAGVSSFAWPREKVKKYAIPPVKVLKNAEMLARMFREKVQQRSRGRYNLLRSFKGGDHALGAELDFNQFHRGCERFGLVISEQDLRVLFDYFDTNKQGYMNSHEFVDHVTSDAWTKTNEKAQPLYLCSFNDFERRKETSMAAQAQVAIESASNGHDITMSIRQQLMANESKVQDLENMFAQAGKQMTFPQFRNAIGRLSGPDAEIPLEELRVLFESVKPEKEDAIQFGDLLQCVLPGAKKRTASTPLPIESDPVPNTAAPDMLGADRPISRSDLSRADRAIRRMVCMKDFDIIGEGARVQSRQK